MKKLFGLALLGVLAAAPAHAQFVSNICGSNADGSVCGAAQFTLSGTTLQVDVFNGTTAATAATPSSISELYFFGIPFTATPYVSAYHYDYDSGAYLPQVNATATFTYSTATQGWMVGLSGGLEGQGNDGISTCAGPVGGGTYYRTCLTDGGSVFGGTSDYVRFTFNLTSAISYEDLENSAWGFHAQAVNNGNSLKCVSAVGSSLTSQVGGGLDQFCEPPDTPQEIVPEPATMTLLATGLAGMAAASRRRRKNVA